MKNKLTFNYPFTSFDHLSFLNCFTSVYMYLEKIVGTDLKECVKEKGKICTGCKGCDDIWYATGFLQESLFFVFGTISGVNTFRPDFDGLIEYKNDTAEIIDFVFKFTGYKYEILTSDFSQKIKMSIDNDKPVLAGIKGDPKNAYRVLIGYDDDKFIIAEAESEGVKNNPDNPVTCDNFTSIIIVNEKVEPKYTLLDSFKLIKEKMEKNEEIGIWDDCIQKFKYWDEKLQDMDFDEIKRRFDRIEQMMWYNFNTHNFMEAFCRKIWQPSTDGAELEDERLTDIIRKINETYSRFHDRNWQLYALNKNRDWSVQHTGEADWGYCGCVVQCLESLKDYDKIVLDEINKAINILTT